MRLCYVFGDFGDLFGNLWRLAHGELLLLQVECLGLNLSVQLLQLVYCVLVLSLQLAHLLLQNLDIRRLRLNRCFLLFSVCGLFELL
jgi:hypothetical protein